MQSPGVGARMPPTSLSIIVLPSLRYSLSLAHSKPIEVVFWSRRFAAQARSPPHSFFAHLHSFVAPNTSSPFYLSQVTQPDLPQPSPATLSPIRSHFPRVQPLSALLATQSTVIRSKRVFTSSLREGRNPPPTTSHHGATTASIATLFASLARASAK
jgi:hypothetical protein